MFQLTKKGNNMKLKLLAVLTALTITVQAMQSPARRPAREQYDLDRAIAQSLQDQYNEPVVQQPASRDPHEDDVLSAIELSIQEQRKQAEVERKDDAFEQMVAYSSLEYEKQLDQELLYLIQFDGTVQDVLRLINKGAHVNALFIDGMTPLMWAARTDRGVICALLIVRGADINAVDSKGMTPLDYAVEAKNIKLCRFLIVNGADLNPSSDTTLLGRAIQNECGFKLYEFLEARGAKL